MSDTQNQQQENSPGKESAKIKLSYDKAMENLITLFKGENNLAISKKLENDDVQILIDEVLKEEVESIKESFKEKAKSLIKAKVNYDNFIKQKEQEFQKAKDEKTKEFTKQANELIQMVKSIGTLQEQYLNALSPTGESAVVEVSTENSEDTAQ